MSKITVSKTNVSNTNKSAAKEPIVATVSAAEPKNSQINIGQLEDMIAKAAYFHAEKRGFTPGHEMQDWLQAEREITAGLY